MKFQNPSMQGSEVMLCIKKHKTRTHGLTNQPEAICPSNFFEVVGIIRKSVIRTIYNSVSEGLYKKINFSECLSSHPGKILNEVCEHILNVGIRKYAPYYAYYDYQTNVGSDGPDQPAHLCSLIWSFPIYLLNHWIL